MAGSDRHTGHAREGKNFPWVIALAMSDQKPANCDEQSWMVFSASRFGSWAVQTLHVELFTNLVLDQELDTLDGGSSGLGDSGGNTTHCESVSTGDLNDVESLQRVGWMAFQ